MQSAWRMLAATIFLAAGMRALGLADSPAGEDPQVVLEQNRRLLEKWRADPEHFARLKRDHAAFKAMSPERQDRLRQFDLDLHSEDPATQARLLAVLERYVAWLDKLDSGDRAWIESAPDPSTRLERVKTIRDKQWVKRLPRQVQEDLAKLPADQRPARIAELRQEERQRRLDWFWASHSRDASALKRARPTRLQEFPPEVRYYYGTALNRILSREKKDRLREAEGNWPLYARTLAKIMETPPPELPGFPDPAKPWPTRFMELPQDWKMVLAPYRPEGKAAKAAQKNHAPESKHRQELARQLQSKHDKWPDYAVTATNIARSEKLKVDSQLGPNKPDHFAPMTQSFIKSELLPKLSEAQRKDLASAEGKWPDYPERLLGLAKQHGLTVPGMARPCPPEFWDAAGKLLPDVPDRALRHFALDELSPDERKELKLSLDDASSRERLVEKYWARHPAELKRQLEPHKSKRP
jgi:hypothetical protein